MTTNSPDRLPNNLLNINKSYPPIANPTNNSVQLPSKSELILCDHCLRTSTNGIKCQGICVADSGY